MSSPEQKLNKIAVDEVNNKCSIEICLQESTPIKDLPLIIIVSVNIART